MWKGRQEQVFLALMQKLVGKECSARISMIAAIMIICCAESDTCCKCFAIGSTDYSPQLQDYALSATISLFAAMLKPSVCARSFFAEASVKGRYCQY